jgi:WD40 repeat protein
MRKQQASPAASATPDFTVPPKLVVRSGSLGSFFKMDVSPDGKWYVTATPEGHVSILSTTNGFENLSFTLPSEGKNYYNVSVSPDSKTIAFPSSLWDGKRSHLFRIDVKSGARLPDVTYGNGAGGLLVRYHPKEDLIAVAQNTGTILVVRPSDGTSLFQGALKGSATALRFSSDGEVLTAATADEVSVWNWRDNQLLWNSDVSKLHVGRLTRTIR